MNENELFDYLTYDSDIYQLHDDFVLALDEDKYVQDFKYWDKTNNSYVVELFDVAYQIDFYKNQYVLASKIQPPSAGDEVERKEIYNKLGKKMDFFKESLESRRVCLTPHYQNMTDLPACLSFLQFSVRENVNLSYKAYDIYCSIKIRSQNIDNFLYDSQTVMSTVQLVIDYLETVLKLTINSGTIFYDITSLHKLIKN